MSSSQKAVHKFVATSLEVLIFLIVKQTNVTPDALGG